jgi:hypothetical protein
MVLHSNVIPFPASPRSQSVVRRNQAQIGRCYLMPSNAPSTFWSMKCAVLTRNGCVWTSQAVNPSSALSSKSSNVGESVRQSGEVSDEGGRLRSREHSRPDL